MDVKEPLTICEFLELDALCIFQKSKGRNGIKGLMVDYSGQKDGYRVWIPGTNNVYQSHDVKFKNEEIVTFRNEFVMLSCEPRKPVEVDVKLDDPVAADEYESVNQPSSESDDLSITVTSP